MSSGQWDPSYYHSWPQDASTWGPLRGHRGDEGKGVHLTTDQPDPQADQMSCWPAGVPLLTTRCLYWGWGHRGTLGVSRGYIWKIKMVYCKAHLKTQDGLLNTEDNRTWAQVNGSQVSTTLGHQMPLPGVHLTTGQPDPMADQMSSWPDIAPLLATRCLLPGGYIWTQVNWT